MSTADARAREAAWLATTGDSLPVLIAPGGPWKNVQAGWPGARFAMEQTGIYVLRKRIAMPRFGGQRVMPGYAFWLKLCWPVRTTTSPLAETEQQNFDSAIDLLVTRVNGLPGDKTHGGRFLSAGETVHPPGGYPDVTFADPEATIPQGWLRADVLYAADDPEIQD